MVWKEEKPISTSQWNYVYLFLVVLGLFSWIVIALLDLQLVHGEEYAERSSLNSISQEYVYPNRGVIYDRDGEILAENVPADNLYLNVNHFYTEDGELDEEKLGKVIDNLKNLLGKDWGRIKDSNFNQLKLEEWVVQQQRKALEEESVYLSELLLLEDIPNDLTITIKAQNEDLEGLFIREGVKRHYPEGREFTHILGYTNVVTGEDLEDLTYLGYEDNVAGNGFNDIVGRLGVEKTYDSELIGEKGVIAYEVDAYGEKVSDAIYEEKEVEPGKNLYLTVDKDVQKKMYEVLKKGVKDYDATGAAGVIQKVDNGELVALVSYPSYDNNSFIGGISEKDYKELLNNERLPLINRPISAEFAPGSTFKTIAAVGALDSGAINQSTTYDSRRGYTFSNGAPFQEYRNNAYGSLTVNGAIAKSSNIFFCEVIRDWEINELVEYYEDFGIGEYTGIDIYGESSGRLPSPENKINLASDPAVTWLDPVWYPEGDGCNTVIGQGIALVTPIQMSNWISAIANGGELKTPHVAKSLEYDGQTDPFTWETKNSKVADKESLKAVREGMWAAVNSSQGTTGALQGAEVTVAAKTGTAEFGKINEDGDYEHAHAWVTGFFPYEDPEYAFVVLLEDGKESYFSAQVAREFIDWFAEEEL